MSDRYGTVSNPIAIAAPGEPATDPGLWIFLEFAQAVLNAKAADAWQQVCPGKLPVEHVFANDPERESFNQARLPALYAFRKGGTAPVDLASDYRVADDTIILYWVLPSTAQAKTRLRSPAVNGIAKALDRSIRRGREPAYSRVGDADTRAASVEVDPDAIKIAIATSTSAASYSGADLDGETGGGAITPPRAVTVTLDGDPDAFVPGSSIVVTGMNILGLSASATLTVPASFPATLTTPSGFSSVTSVDVEAQADTGGTIAVGARAYVGLGSVLITQMSGIRLLPAKTATPRLITIQIEGETAARGERPRTALTYPAIEWQFTLSERLELDPAEYDENEGVDVFVTRSDGTAVTEFQT